MDHRISGRGGPGRRGEALIPLALAAWALGGCTALSFRPVHAFRTLLDLEYTMDLDSPESVDEAMEELAGARGTGGNAVELLSNGEEAFPRMLESIDGARERVCLATFIFRVDGAGARFVEALAGAARRGVEVRLLVDALGNPGLSRGDLAAVEEAGGTVRFVNDPMGWTLIRVNNRDHRKILVVDGRIAFMGGLNVGDEYDGDGLTGMRDTAFRVEGPAAARAERIFAESWEQGGGGWLGKDIPFWGLNRIKRLADRPLLSLGFDPRFEPPRPPPMRAGGTRVWAVGNRPDDLASPILETYLLAIHSARERVWITNSYFVPPRRLVRVLCRAAERGVDVRLLLPREPDEPLVGPLARSAFGELLRSGVRIYRWDASRLHAKTMVVDGRWATAGSCNLNTRGCFMNYEANFVVLDPGVARSMEDRFLRDIARSRRTSLESWERRSGGKRFEELLCGLLRGQS